MPQFNQQPMDIKTATERLETLINGSLRNGYFADHKAVDEMVLALSTLSTKAAIGEQLMMQKKEVVKRNTENDNLGKQLFPIDTNNAKEETDGNNI